MELIIVIPDKDRRDIYWVKGKRVANLIGEYKVLAVLPEEHGDLISRNALKEDFADMREGYPIFSDTEMLSTKDIAKIIDTAPTIIEADRESGNDS